MYKTIFKIIFLITATSMISCTQTPKVLLIVGGHDYDTTEFFQMFYSMEGIAFDSASHPGVMQILQSEEAGSYDMLLFYDFIPDMPLKDSAVFISLSQQGKPMLFLHHALATFQGWEGYRQMVGGKYIMPGFTTDTSLLSDYKHDIDLRIEVMDQVHPVLKNIKEFVIHDEGYSNIQLQDGIHPLLGSNHPDCAPLVGWVNHYNQSTCLYLMFGHDKRAYANESFQQLMQNSIHWLTNL